MADTHNSERPQTIQGDLRNLPDALAPLVELRHWLLWQWEKPKKEGSKWTKVPYQPGGRKAESDNPATWNPYDVVVSICEQRDGIGFCLTDTNIAAMDVDDCRDPATGAIDPWAQKLVDDSKSYAEITVSGTGLRILGRGNGPPLHRKQKAVNGVTLETYRRATRYVVVTGNQLAGTPSVLADIDPLIDVTVVRLDEKNNVKRETYTGPAGPIDVGEIPSMTAALLHIPNKGAGVPHGPYASRSELAFAFITSAALRKVGDASIIAACLDDAHSGHAIREHCRDEGEHDYVVRQIEHARARIQERSKAQQAQPQPQEIKVFRHGEASVDPGPQLIRNRLPEVGKGLLSGQWGTFKTFMFIDLSCSVMVGGFWTKEPVYRQGGVLVFAPEGAGGIGLRLKAMVEGTLPRVVAECEELPKTLTPSSVDPARLPFEWTDTCPPLIGAADPLPTMMRVAEQTHERFMREFNLPLVMIGIDTMSAASNSTSDDDNAEWAKIMALMERFGKATGTAVVGVDHYGKNQEVGTRGASAKEANADFVLSTLAERALSGEVRNTRLALRKLRDGPQGFELPFSGRLIDMGVDQHGLPVTSRVIDWNASTARRKTLTETMLEAALATAISEHGEPIQVEGAEVRAARVEWVRQAFKQLYLTTKPEATSNAVKLAFKRAREGAEGVETQGDFMYLAEGPM